MTDTIDLLAPNQPFYSRERTEQRLRAEIERLRAEAKQHFDQAMANGASAAAERERATRAESELAAIKLRLIEDCDAARDFPANTCGASRHAQMIAESLISGVPYAMLTDDPAYCGQSILSTVKSLFTARTELAALREEIARYATSLTVALGHRDEFKRRAEAAESELAALRGRIAAAPVVCIDNGACVTDGARLTIAGGDTYFAHAELCGKRVRLLIEPTSLDSSPSSSPDPDRSPGSSTR